jgi:hypothetical protein
MGDKKVAVYLGALSPNIGEQFPDMDGETARHFELDKMALCRLSIKGLISRAEAERARRRLVKAISSEIRKG